MSNTIDPITLEIWWSRLVSVADEAAATLLRTAFTPIIRESNDFATVLLDENGESIGECTGGIPTFAGLLPSTAKHFLRKFPKETWKEGDCVITNSPWIATGHLPDIAMIRPIFYQDKLVAFSGSVAHTPDVGGTLGPGNRELFEEGICIPPMHLYRDGQRNEAMLELFLNNIRAPDLMLGDLEAQLSANDVCRRRTIDFLQSSGLDDLVELSRNVRESAEQSTRDAISAIPDGVYHGAVDADGFDDHPTHIRCEITVAGDTMKVDYAGSSPQIDRGINSPMNYTWAYTVYPIRCALGALSRRNGGSYRPIEVTAPEGSILNPKFPAAVASRNLTGHLLCCAIYQALSKVIPERVLADSGGAPAMRVRFVGKNKEDQRFTMQLFVSAGMGASSAADGLSTTAFPTNSGAGSIEALEAINPVLFHKKEYRVDSGGRGRYRGGLGQEITVENITEAPLQVIISGDREKNPAKGLMGGEPGALASARLDDGSAVSLKSRTLLPPGDAISILFAGGGGYGEAAERTPKSIARDLRYGFVSENPSTATAEAAE